MKTFFKNYFLATGLFTFIAVHVNAQTIISGAVSNNKNEPVNAASIRIKESNTGVNTDSSGKFILSITGKGKRILEISSVGYTSKEMTLDLHDSIVHLDIILKEESKTLGDVVVVSAGTFEASDKAKGASLTPMDAVTVAGNGGDIANALRSLPGTQQVGDREGLFVRGGTSAEAKQFVDGALLPNPNYASVPGLVQPARLNPFLFKGILFSTGGYSALYGDALSSALILETVDLPEKSSAALNIFPQNIGAGFQKLSKDEKSSYGVHAGYGNMQFYNRFIPQKPDFFHGPEYLSVDGNFRIRTSKTGMLKFYSNYEYSRVGMRNQDIDSSDLLSSFEVKNTNVYTNLSYRESLGNNWKIDAVTAYNYYKAGTNNQLLDKEHQQVFIGDSPYDEKNNSTNIRSDFAQEKIVLRKQFSHNQALRFGAEYFYTNDDYLFHNNSRNTSAKFNDNRVAVFAEGDIYVTKSIAAKIGLRAEYSSLLNESALAPRLSLAYRFHDGGQLNAAFGIFYQKPEIVYLAENNKLNFSRATHYVINYQKRANNRLFRIEAYYKNYDALVTTFPQSGNRGDGYARGVELFWRDKKTFKNFDYWISYTYLDTKRKFLDYPYSIRPDYTTPHTLSIALKKYFQDINLSANLSYTLATGRPYYDIQTNATGKSFINDQGTTNAYNSMNLSFAYLFSMFPKWKNKEFSGIGFGINNLFGTRQVFGYNYSYDGRNKVPVTQPATRSYYIGLFMNFGIDRRDDFINENL